MTQKLVIDRSKWHRGEGSQGSALLRIGDEKMCCLGFYALASGFSKEEIRGRHYPDSLERPWACAILKSEADPANTCRLEAFHDTPVVCTELGRKAAWHNDRSDISGEEREAELTALFAENGVEVEFIN